MEIAQNEIGTIWIVSLRLKFEEKNVESWSKLACEICLRCGYQNLKRTERIGSKNWWKLDRMKLDRK